MSEHNNQPENPTPFIEYTPLPSGTTATPFLTHVTKSGRKIAEFFTQKNDLYRYFGYTLDMF